MHKQVYHSAEIQAWEQRWFQAENSAYGLMQQAAWAISQRLVGVLRQKNIDRIAVCCGQGNNAGDGYLVAKYLSQQGFKLDIYAAQLGSSSSLQQAYAEAKAQGLNIQIGFDFRQTYDCYIDALFGIGLNRQLNSTWQNIIAHINAQSGFKVAIDLPSGLDANTGRALPNAIKADLSYSILALKAGLFTGQAKEYTGCVQNIALIPTDAQLNVLAHISPEVINLPIRDACAHKGSYGHALIVGGHEHMGGAVILAAEAAFAAGAGKVTVVCHAKHHAAILTRAPNVMLRDIQQLTSDQITQLLQQVDSVAFGMGLGRDEWAEQHYLNWFSLLMQANVQLILDADALWFLALHPVQLNAQVYATPHPGEAAKLLSCSTLAVEEDRVAAIQQLKTQFQGQWVLKGAGSLILEDQLWICPIGNPGMATAGMGDILSGMLAGLSAQFQTGIHLHEVVTLHALAGDQLADTGMRGLQAQDMLKAIYRVIN